MRISTITAATLFLAQAVPAQPIPEPADPVYHVEVILFAFNDGSRAEEDLHHGPENAGGGPIPELLTLPDIELESVFDARAGETAERSDGVAAGGDRAAGVVSNPADAVTAPAGDSLELFETATGRGMPAADRPPAGFRPLLQSELELEAEKRTLDRIAAYTVLAHAGWALSGVDSERAVPLDLKRIGITNPRGTIEVYLGRYLHARLDLEFLDGSGTLWQSARAPGLSPLGYADTYRLTTEVNAIRSGELHVADHPLYGVLIRITPAPDPEDDQSGSAGGPAG